MLDFIIACVMNALLTAFAMSLGHKWGVIELVQARGNKLFSEMFRCSFCLCFWTGIVLGVIACIVTGDLCFMAMSFFSTPMAQKIMKW